MSVRAVIANACTEEQMRSCHGCFVKCKRAESGGQAQSVLMTDWLVLVQKDAAPLRLDPASNKYTASSELGIANSSSSLEGLDCFVAVLPGETAAGGQRPGEAWGRDVRGGGTAATGQRCLRFPPRPWCSYQKHKARLAARITATEIRKGGRRSSHSWLGRRELGSFLGSGPTVPLSCWCSR